MRQTKAHTNVALLIATLLVFVGIPFVAYAISWETWQQQLNQIEANQGNLSAQERLKTSQLLGTWQEKNIPTGSLQAQKEAWENLGDAGQANIITKYIGTYGEPDAGTRDQNKEKAVQEDPSGQDTGGRCGAWWKYITSPINCFLAPMVTALVGGIILGIAGSLLALSGYLFDILVSTFIVAFGETVKSLSIIDGIHTGWTILRDMSNILIIGMFTFIAISIIIGNHTFGQRKLVAKVLVVAVLINFSLLFAKIIIDSSNFIAWQVYKKMAPAGSGDSLARGAVAGTNANISNKFLAIAGATTFFSGGIDVFKATQNSIASARDAYGIVGGFFNIDVLAGVLKGVFYSLLASIFMLFAAGVLLYGSFLILSRAVLLIVLMLVSALAFATYLIPSLSGGEYGWSAWWKSLINAAIFGPLLMLLLYLSIVIVTPFAGQRGSGSIGNAINNPSAASAADWKLMFMFVISIGLLYASFKVANSFSSKIAGFSMATSVVGKGASLGLGAAALAGRFGGGIAAKKIAVSGIGQKAMNNKVFGRMIRAGLYGAGTGSWDARNLPGAKSFQKLTGMPLGDAVKGGYVQDYAARKKKVDTRNKEIEDWVTEATRKEVRAQQDGKAAEKRLEDENKRLEERNKAIQTQLGKSEEGAIIKKEAVRREREADQGELDLQGGRDHKQPLGAEQSAAPAQTEQQVRSHKQDLDAQAVHIETSASIAREHSIEPESLDKFNESIADLTAELQRNRKTIDENKRAIKERLLPAMKAADEAKDRIQRRKDSAVERTRNTRFFSLWDDGTEANALADSLKGYLGKSKQERHHDELGEALHHFLQHPPAAHPPAAHPPAAHPPAAHHSTPAPTGDAHAKPH